jgi:hypothetical protein
LAGAPRATRRAYRKEAERLILWAVLERGKALCLWPPATAYRAFLRRPAPAALAGVAAVRRGAVGALHQVRGIVLGALFRWLIEQRYVLANPFAGMKVRSAAPH